MAITFVGAWTGAQGSNVTSLTTASQTTVPGNLIACGITIDVPANFTSLTDSKSNTWIQDAPASGWYAGSGSGSMRLHHAENIVGGASHTINLAMSANSLVTIQAAEYGGLATSSAIDQIHHGSATGTGTALDSTATPTTTLADELLIGFGREAVGGTGTLTWTAGASYTIRSSTADATNGDTAALEDRIVAATGAYGATMSFTGGSSLLGWDMLIATFMAPPAGGSGDSGSSGGTGMQRPVAAGWT